MNNSALLHRINNLVRFRTVTSTKSADGQALARVKTSEDSVSDFLPVMSLVNTFKRHWIPIRPGEQVLVLSPFGEADSGVIIRGIFNKGRKEHPLANDHTEVIDFEDGTVITYDTQAKEMKINAVGAVNIICKSATLQADTVDITAITTHTGNVTIDGLLHATEGISTDTTFTDVRGDLTNFNTTDGAARA